ncbi:TonB-dependent receptor [Litorilituus sediminis]|uniref:TonB-dependent receptor n=1 Tax=Litorilituus sediminis TaxID=718192 RepID=A0A4P6P457_9GAMM|nr:TonB-dependent receptor [Litorilituus sediminis]QBG36114.1 TonB-dependent receptor [Litorilituus sediminis]
MTTKNSWQRFQYSALAIACSAALFSSHSFAAESNFSGRITDASNTVYFEGAKVRIKELNLIAVSQRDGSFSFNNLPEGDYTLEIVYLGVPKTQKRIKVTATDSNQIFVIGDNKDAMDNIIVYGQRAGQAGAINRQKNADNLMSVVSADTIGQSPDQNAAEALQRLPGISIQRDQGEGRFVTIRGIDPNLNNVTINGVNVPSPESGVRSVAMDVIPSELIQSLEVSKTVTPDMDASAVGGSIEVKSLSAFDRQGQSYSATIQGSYNELMEDTSPKLSGSFTDIFELSSGAQLGVATAVSWFERTFGSHNIETDGGWAEFEFEDAETGDDVEVFSAEEIEQRYYQITRERLGAALNFDLHTSATDKYYFRTLYSRFSDDEYRLRNQYKFDKGAIDLSSYTDSSAQFYDAEMERDTKDRFEEQEILSLVLGGENQFSHWLLEYDLGYSKSSESEPNRIDVAFAGEDLALGYLSTGAVPALTQASDAHDLNNFAMDEITYENNLSEDEELSIKVDVSRDFVWQNHNGQFKFGVKHQAREKFNRADVTIYDGGFDDVTAQQFSASAPGYNLGNFGPGIQQGSLNQFVMANRASFDINEQDSRIDSQGGSFVSNEDVTSAYAMVTLDINDWRIITGVRYEGTSFDTQGNKVELIKDEVNDEEQVVISPWQVSKDYHHVLPSLNVRYNVSEHLVARFAYTQTIARPEFGDSAAYQLIESEISEDDGNVETERKAEVGNPELDPYESDNLDFSIEYYPGHIGVLSAGVFYKDIDNYILKAEVQDNGEWDGYDEVIQPINGGSASLTGLELAWTKNFQSGLFVSANGTFVDTDDTLPNQADTVANLMLGYENNHFSARLSTTYKSESFQFDDNDASVYEDTHTQVDFTAKYFINNTMQVYFNAVNLTDEPMYLYHGSSRYNYQYEEYGRSFELGFTINSL